MKGRSFTISLNLLPKKPIFTFLSEGLSELFRLNINSQSMTEQRSNVDNLV